MCVCQFVCFAWYAVMAEKMSYRGCICCHCFNNHVVRLVVMYWLYDNMLSDCESQSKVLSLIVLCVLCYWLFPVIYICLTIVILFNYVYCSICILSYCPIRFNDVDCNYV